MTTTALFQANAIKRILHKMNKENKINKYTYVLTYTHTPARIHTYILKIGIPCNFCLLHSACRLSVPVKLIYDITKPEISRLYIAMPSTNLELLPPDAKWLNCTPTFPSTCRSF